MEQQLNFIVKSVYGRDLFYPQNKQAEFVASLIGKKTLTLEQVKILIQMGFRVAQQPVDIEIK